MLLSMKHEEALWSKECGNVQGDGLGNQSGEPCMTGFLWDEISSDRTIKTGSQCKLGKGTEGRSEELFLKFAHGSPSDVRFVGFLSHV